MCRNQHPGGSRLQQDLDFQRSHARTVQAVDASFFMFQVTAQLGQCLFQFFAGNFHRLLAAYASTFKNRDAFWLRFFSQLVALLVWRFEPFPSCSLGHQSFFSRRAAFDKRLDPLLPEFGASFGTLSAAFFGCPHQSLRLACKRQYRQHGVPPISTAAHSSGFAD